MREIINDELIQDCEAQGASTELLAWLRESPRTLDQLLHRDLEWLNWFASKTTVRGAIYRLATDEGWFTRAAVARNEATPAFVLEVLARDPSGVVRVAVIQNPSSTEAILKRLQSDGDEDIRQMATDHLEFMYCREVRGSVAA